MSEKYSPQDVERVARAIAQFVTNGGSPDTRVIAYPQYIGGPKQQAVIVEEDKMTPLWNLFIPSAWGALNELSERPIGWKPEPPTAKELAESAERETKRMEEAFSTQLYADDSGLDPSLRMWREAHGLA